MSPIVVVVMSICSSRVRVKSDCRMLIVGGQGTCKASFMSRLGHDCYTTPSPSRERSALRPWTAGLFVGYLAAVAGWTGAARALPAVAPCGAAAVPLTLARGRARAGRGDRRPALRAALGPRRPAPRHRTGRPADREPEPAGHLQPDAPAPVVARAASPSGDSLTASAMGNAATPLGDRAAAQGPDARARRRRRRIA